jgi:hypothetical protein
MQRRERVPQPAHNVLLLLGMAAVSWAAIGFTAVALWPRQSGVMPVSGAPLAVRHGPDPPVASAHGHHRTAAVAGKKGATARQAVRRKSKVASRRRRGPSFAARVFSASVY